MADLKVGFVALDDIESVRSWSGIPYHMLHALRDVKDVRVEAIGEVGVNLAKVYLPFKAYYRLRGQGFEWMREDMSLRYFAWKIAREFSRRKLDVLYSNSSILCAHLDPGIPYVFWTDGCYQGMEGYYSNPSSRTLRAGRRQETLSLHRADGACYASEWAASAAKKIANPERVHVIPFGVNLDIQHSRDDVERWIADRRSASRSRCTLLFVGVDWIRKGGKVAVETARRMHAAGIETKLRVVGCVPDEPVPEFVDVVGFVSKHEPAGIARLMELYRTSDIFILPSRAEAFGVVVGEGAAFGLPALVCATGGLAETVREGKSGYALPVEDGGELYAARALDILRNYEDFARAAFAEYETRLNWRVGVERLTAVLRNAAGR
jgi:glycosyltransferase involved in cell wall biosynthesis